MIHAFLCKQVAATGVGSTLSLLGNLVAYGAIRRRGGETLATCGVEALLRDLGTALHLFPAFVRVRLLPPQNNRVAKLGCKPHL